MKAVLIAGVTSIFLAGCATSVETANRLASGMPDWELCYVTLDYEYSANMRAAAQDAIRYRRVNCAEHASMIQAKQASDSAHTAKSLQMIQFGQQLMNQPRLPAASETSVAPGKYGPLKATYTSNLNRICVYSTPLGDATTTISATSICPSVGP